jgi:hypothetical protein
MQTYIIVIIVVVVALIGIAAYYLWPSPVPPHKGCKRNASDPGACDFDKDCNAPNGQCYKDSNGVCSCLCAQGYSGKNCEIKGIPYDSPHCMGPNSQWPPRKDKEGLCVCPVGNWADGTDPQYGYVQCLTCAGDWGPLSGNSPCQSKWMSTELTSENCYGPDVDPNTVCQREDEFGYTISQTGPGGIKGSASFNSKLCSDSQGCHCKNPEYNSKVSRPMCKVTGWQNPDITNQTCETSTGKERGCSSYKCTSNAPNNGYIQVGNELLSNVSMNNKGELCGIDKSSEVWCTFNYNDGNAAVWKKSTGSNSLLRQISVADTGKVVGSMYIGGELTGTSKLSSTYNDNYLTIGKSLFTTISPDGNLFCLNNPFDPSFDQNYCSDNKTKNSPINQYVSMSINNNGAFCGITAGGNNTIECGENWMNGKLVMISQSPGGSLNNLVLNNNGKLCAATSAGVFCKPSYSGNGWVKGDQEFVNITTDDNGDICGVKSDRTVWCKSK